MPPREARRWNVHHKPVACPMCGHDKFWTRDAQLNTAAATFFNVDWANATGTCLVCDSCAYILWFYERPWSLSSGAP